MRIQDHETASAVVAGLAGAADWLQKNLGGAVNWIKAKAINLSNLAIELSVNPQLVFQLAKQGWDSLKQWLKGAAGNAKEIAGTACGALLVSAQGVIAPIGGKIKGFVKANLGAVIGVGITAGAAIAKVAGFDGKAILRAVVGVAQQIFNFNFNATDKDLRAQQAEILKNLQVNAGGALGQALGAILCGTTASLGVVKIDVALTADLFDIIDDDTKDEILDAFTELLYFTKQAMWQISFNEVYGNARRWIKKNIKTGVKEWDAMIAAWGEEGSKPWTIAEFINTTIEEKFKDDETMKEIAEEFVENFMDSCSEALWQAAY